MIHLTRITKQYGDQILYSNGSFQINREDRIGLVGPNGAGKSTIFRVITKAEGVDSGSVRVADKTVIGYFSQEVGEMKGCSALEYVKAGAGKVSQLAATLADLEKKLEDAGVNPVSDGAMNALLEKYGEAQLDFEQLGGYDLDTRAKEVLTGLGIGPDDYDKQVETFSGGWKMRIALAQILTLNPDVLLMDEPTNHLDMESIIWLEEWLKNFKGAIVMTSHDREFMNRLVNRIVEIANKQITSYTGDYDFYEREREIRRQQLQASFEKQNALLAKEEEFIARFAARASHAAQVQSRVKKLDKIDRIEIPPEEKVMHFTFAVPPRSGNDVVTFTNLGKIWKQDNGKDKQVLSGLTGTITRLNKIALVGVNGAGKSTLLKIITGDTAPTEGKIQLGSNVKIGYFSQHSLEVLDDKKTMFEEIHDRVPDATIGWVRSLLGAFNFSGDDVHKKISVLSGGEKSRVVLATLLSSSFNLLVLDEPTNHLDIKSREVLLKAVQNFQGTVILVSHDRHFLRSITNRVFEINKGALHTYEGDYNYYLRKRGDQAGH